MVRALSLGYGLLATMDGNGLDDVLNALHDPVVGTDPDERSRLGVVLALADDTGTPRVVVDGNPLPRASAADAATIAAALRATVAQGRPA